MNPTPQEIRWLLEDKYGGVKTPQFFEDLERLKAGEPVDYLIGWVPFLDATVDLSERPLIPRVETEYWTEKAAEDMRKHKQELRVLDIFAGAGNIGLGVLKQVPNARVDFAEKSKSALKGIAKSCQMNGFAKKRYRIIESDVFSSVSGKYDYILGNPPYVAEEDEEKVDESVLEWEPRMAVFGGRKGERFVRRFLLEAPRHLKPGGKLYMEFDYFQKKNVEKILEESAFSSFSFRKDQYGKWRYCVALA